MFVLGWKCHSRPLKHLHRRSLRCLGSGVTPTPWHPYIQGVWLVGGFTPAHGVHSEMFGWNFPSQAPFPGSCCSPYSTSQKAQRGLILLPQAIETALREWTHCFLSSPFPSLCFLALSCERQGWKATWECWHSLKLGFL